MQTMQRLRTLLALFSSFGAAAAGGSGGGGWSLWGSHGVNDQLLPLSSTFKKLYRGVHRRFLQNDNKQDFKAEEEEEREKFCLPHIGEILMLHDVSSSFESELPQIRQQVPQAFEKIAKKMPGSKFSVGVFSDKAVAPFGVESFVEGRSLDQCYDNRIKMTDNITAIAESLDTVQIQDGGDMSESQLDALFHGINSEQVGWTNDTLDPTGIPYVRIVILTTDAPWHKPLDHLQSVFVNLPQHDKRPEPACSELDYPEEDWVIDSFRMRGIRPIFLISPFSEYETFKLDWLDLNYRIGMNGAVYDLSRDSNNLQEAIEAAVAKMTCESATTTSTTTILPLIAAPGDGNVGTILGALAGVAALLLLLYPAYLAAAWMKEPPADMVNDAHFDFLDADQEETIRETIVEVDADSFFGEPWN